MQSNLKDKYFGLFQVSGKYRLKTGERYPFLEVETSHKYDLINSSVFDDNENEILELANPFLKPQSIDQQLDDVLLLANGRITESRVQKWLDYHYQKTSNKVNFREIIEEKYGDGKARLGKNYYGRNDIPETIDNHKLHAIRVWLKNNEDTEDKATDLEKIMNIFKPLTEKDNNGQSAISDMQYNLLVDALHKFLTDPSYIPKVDANNRIHFNGDNEFIYSHFYHFYDCFTGSKRIKTQGIATVVQHIVVGKRTSNTGQSENLTAKTINTYIKKGKDLYLKKTSQQD